MASDTVRLPQPLQVVKARLMVDAEKAWDAALNEMVDLQHQINQLIGKTVTQEMDGLYKELTKARAAYVAAITKSCQKYPQFGAVVISRIMPPDVGLKPGDVNKELDVLQRDGRGAPAFTYNTMQQLESLAAHTPRLPALGPLIEKFKAAKKRFEVVDNVKAVTDEKILAYGGPLVPTSKGKELDVDKIVAAIMKGISA